MLALHRSRDLPVGGIRSGFAFLPRAARPLGSCQQRDVCSLSFDMRFEVLVAVVLFAVEVDACTVQSSDASLLLTLGSGGIEAISTHGSTFAVANSGTTLLHEAAGTLSAPTSCEIGAETTVMKVSTTACSVVQEWRCTVHPTASTIMHATVTVNDTFTTGAGSSVAIHSRIDATGNTEPFTAALATSLQWSSNSGLANASVWLPWAKGSAWLHIVCNT